MMAPETMTVRYRSARAVQRDARRLAQQGWRTAHVAEHGRKLSLVQWLLDPGARLGAWSRTRGFRSPTRSDPTLYGGEAALGTRPDQYYIEVRYERMPAGQAREAAHSGAR